MKNNTGYEEGIGNIQIKVLHIITRFIAGGADENTLFTVEGLRKNSYKVTLAAGPDSEQEMVQRLKKSDYYLIPSLQRNLNPVKDIKAFWTLFRLIKREKFHIVHTHVAKAGILGRLAAKFAGVPVIIHTLHGITFHKHLHPAVRLCYLFLERISEKFTDRFVDVGEDLQDIYIKNKVGRPGKHTVIRSGFEIGKFINVGNNREKYKQEFTKHFGLPTDSLLIGTAARLEPRKGIQYFIEAASQINGQFPNAHYLVAGKGSHRAQFESLVKKAGLEDRFHFVGFIEEIEKFMAALDIFILSSLWEGLPRSLVQAGAVGLPVVSFQVEGVTEVVKDA